MQKFKEEEVNIAITLILGYIAVDEADNRYGSFYTLPSTLIDLAAGRTGKKARNFLDSLTPETDQRIRTDCKMLLASCKTYQNTAIKYLLKIMIAKWKIRRETPHALSIKDEYGRYLLILAETFKVKIKPKA
ncbi:MAG: hypothetical protein HY507_02185 [Candidatus Zambryskibacteria bacterium]|nr:hypothetical protein [Candidatus Zambryskibacteria bacterium]